MKNLESYPLISIVTLNHNNIEATLELLESSQKLSYPNYEFLCLDMGSQQNPFLNIDEENYPNVKFIRSDTNMGCSGGRNYGIKLSKGEFVFIVDNDTVLTPDLLQNLLEPMLQDETVGVCCPKIKYYHHPDVIQYAGFNPMNRFTGRTSAIGSKEKDTGKYDEPGYTNCAHGCAMLIRKKVLDEIGAFAVKFLAYYEELDWSERLKKAGHKIYYNPNGVIYHKQSMTLGLNSPKKLYFMTRNRILYMRRNSNLGEFMVFSLFFTFVAVPKHILRFLFKGQMNHLSSFAQGIAWNFTTSKYSEV